MSEIPAGVISEFVLVSGGSGYTTPAVVISGGGGVGASGNARVSNGVVLAVDLVSGGSGYSSVPTVTLRDPNPRASGALVTAILPNPALPATDYVIIAVIASAVALGIIAYKFI